MSRNYLIALVLCLGPASVLATQIRSAALARLLALLAVALAFAVIAIISVILERGKRRFRELWNEEHGAPITSI
jgi:membrane protein implicated in regulation of membrane protease activity